MYIITVNPLAKWNWSIGSSCVSYQQNTAWAYSPQFPFGISISSPFQDLGEPSHIHQPKTKLSGENSKNSAKTSVVHSWKNKENLNPQGGPPNPTTCSAAPGNGNGWKGSMSMRLIWDDKRLSWYGWIVAAMPFLSSQKSVSHDFDILPKNDQIVELNTRSNPPTFRVLWSVMTWNAAFGKPWNKLAVWRETSSSNNLIKRIQPETWRHETTP